MLQSGLSFGPEPAEPTPASINPASCLGVLSLGSRTPQQFHTSYQNTFVLDTFLNRPRHCPTTFHSPQPVSASRSEPGGPRPRPAPLRSLLQPRPAPNGSQARCQASGIRRQRPGDGPTGREAHPAAWEPGRGLAEAAWRLEVAAGGRDD